MLCGHTLLKSETNLKKCVFSSYKNVKKTTTKESCGKVIISNIKRVEFKKNK